MNKAALVVRYLMGLIFFVFGLNGFFHFIPTPPMQGKSLDFLMAMINTGYLFPVLKAVEVLVGASLLSGYYVRLALVVIAPVTLNIFLFHAVLAQDGLPISIVLIGSNIFLAYVNKDAYASVLKAKG